MRVHVSAGLVPFEGSREGPVCWPLLACRGCAPWLVACALSSLLHLPGHAPVVTSSSEQRREMLPTFKEYEETGPSLITQNNLPISGPLTASAKPPALCKVKHTGAGVQAVSVLGGEVILPPSRLSFLAGGRALLLSSHLTSGETEAQGGQVTCPRPSRSALSRLICGPRRAVCRAWPPPSPTQARAEGTGAC